jgi:putative flippase GtrA
MQLLKSNRFVVFLAVGILNTLFGYGVFAGLLMLGANPTMAIVGATILGVAFNFRSIGQIVFGHKQPGRLPRFLAVYGFQCLANIALLRLLVAAGLSPLIGQALLLLPLAGTAFLLMRRFVFAANPGETPT